jgi:hypothetical protein
MLLQSRQGCPDMAILPECAIEAGASRNATAGSFIGSAALSQCVAACRSKLARMRAATWESAIRVMTALNLWVGNRG